MKKQQVFTLDIDDEPLEYDGQAYLFFHTATPGFAFVDDLNRLYGLQLSRKSDMQLRDSFWPVYAYRDPLSNLQYYIVERPASSDTTAPHWMEGHKLMLLLGDDACRTADRIADDFGNPVPPPPPGDHNALRRQAILEGYQQALMTLSRLTLAEEPTASLSKKAAKERAELENLVYDILDYLDCQGGK